MQMILRRSNISFLSLPQLSPQATGIACVVAVAFAMAADYYTGAKHSPLVFYLIPVICSAWISSAAYGVVTTIAAAIGLAIIELLSTEEHYSSPIHNALTGVVVLAVLYIAVRRVRSQILALEQANLKLLAANRDKDRLFRIISHDLTSPFNAMLGYTELLEDAIGADSTMSPKTQEYVRHCRGAALGAYRLLSDLLEWAKAQMGGANRAPIVINSKALIDKCASAFASAALLKTVKLDTGSVDENLALFADPLATETVLRNLIDNAIKFTPGGGTVKVCASTKGEAVAISIEDTGVGISPARLKTMFEYTGASSTLGTGGELGSGLGLPLCKDLIEQNGGAISVTSTEGVGTHIVITLPVA